MKRGFTLGLFLMLLVHFNIQAETEFVAYTGGDSIVFSDESKIRSVFYNNSVDTFVVRGELTSNAVSDICEYGYETKYVMDWSKAIFVSESYSMKTRTFYRWEVERFYFPEENPYEYEMNFSGAFGGAKNLKHIYNFEKLNHITSLYNTFAGCASLDSIILTDNVAPTMIEKKKQEGISGRKSEDCPAITVVDSALYVIFPDYFITAFNNLVTTFDSIISVDYVSSNGRVSWIQAKTPYNIIANDTIWKVGESFETAKILSCEELREYKLEEGHQIWCGLRNECIKTYRWKKAVRHAETMVAKYKKGETTIHPLDMFADSLYLGLDSIKIMGAIRQSEMDTIEKIVQMKNASIRSLDMSAAYFAEPLQVKLGKSPLRKIILPLDTCRYEINLEDAFESSEELKEVKNLDKLYFITNLNSTFHRCRKLISVTLPDTSMRIDSLSGTFFLCDSLKKVNNFDKIENIRYMSYTFNGCESLESISFSTQMDSSVYLDDYLFDGCVNLKHINNLEYVKISYVGYKVFRDCHSLSDFQLNITQKTQYTSPYCSDCVSDAFDGCDALIYLVNGLGEIPNWLKRSSTHVVYPIDSFYIHFNDETGKSVVSNLSPKFCAIQDTVWKCVKGETEVIVKNIQEVNKDEYDAFYCGIKNDSMPDYVWSKNQVYWNVANYDKYVSYSLPNSFKSFIPIEKLQPGQLHYADSIFTYGDLNNEDIVRLKQSLKLVSGQNEKGCEYLLYADFSNSRIDVTDGFVGFFQNATYLNTVKFPKEKVLSPVDFTNAFASAGPGYSEREHTSILGLRQVDLSCFENIICMNSTFSECKELKRVFFSDTENNNEVSFIQTFVACPLDSIDLSSFTRISDLSQTFALCEGLDSEGIRYIKFSDKENPLSISMFQTFGGTGFNTSEIINFDKFTNVNNFLATFQQANLLSSKVRRLDTIRFGTDPNKIPSDSLTWTFARTYGRIIKYLPDGVDTIPSAWRKYHNFVVPVTVDESNWSVDSLLSDFFSLPEFGPTYAYISDTTWYLILNDYLLPWLQEFGFTNASLHAGLMAPASSSQYMVVDPETVNISEYMDDYTLACVVSNPKYKTLVYDVKLKDLLGDGVSDIAFDANCRIFAESGAIVVSPSSEMEVKVYDLLGKLVRTCVAEKDQETKVTVPSGVYLVKCGNYPSKKVTVK